MLFVLRLFHHLVDTDRTGTILLKEMNRMHLPGEVTFMPLNRLENRETHYPNTTVSKHYTNELGLGKLFISYGQGFVNGAIVSCEESKSHIARQVARSSCMPSCYQNHNCRQIDMNKDG